MRRLTAEQTRQAIATEIEKYAKEQIAIIQRLRNTLLDEYGQKNEGNIEDYITEYMDGLNDGDYRCFNNTFHPKEWNTSVTLDVDGVSRYDEWNERAKQIVIDKIAKSK